MQRARGARMPDWINGRNGGQSDGGGGRPHIAERQGHMAAGVRPAPLRQARAARLPFVPARGEEAAAGDGLPAIPTEQDRRGSDGASTHTWHVCPQPSGSGSHSQTWTSPVRQTTTLANATTAAALPVIIFQIVRLICMPRTV